MSTLGDIQNVVQELDGRAGVRRTNVIPATAEAPIDSFTTLLKRSTEDRRHAKTETKKTDLKAQFEAWAKRSEYQFRYNTSTAGLMVQVGRTEVAAPLTPALSAQASLSRVTRKHMSLCLQDDRDKALQELLESDSGLCEMTRGDLLGVMLEHAVRLQALRCTALLLSYGADPLYHLRRKDSPFGPGEIPQAWSSQQGSILTQACTRWRRAKQRDAREDRDDGECANAAWPLVELLIKRGGIALLNKPDDKGETPLHTAARFGETELVDVLTKHRADVSCRNTHGARPLHLARHKGDQLLRVGTGTASLAAMEGRDRCRDSLHAAGEAADHRAKRIISSVATENCEALFRGLDAWPGPAAP